MSRVARDGLAWDDTKWNLAPVWTREPQLESIAELCREKLRLEESKACDVSFYAEGAFNKIYLVRTTNQQLIMRVSLPVHPRNKTRGEVTTLRYLKRTTDLPVPEVIDFDDSNQNKIGFEWILMELMPGVAAYKKWRTMTTYRKVALAQRVAEYQAQILRCTFSGIGTLSYGGDEQKQKEEPGELVSKFFFWEKHFDYDIFRGPFRSSHDWLTSYLDIAVDNYIADKKEAEDEEDEQDAEFGLSVTRRLRDLLPKIFPSIQSPPERSCLAHKDLSLANILVNEEGEITAIIDWECVNAMPLWMATNIPKFLDDSVRENEPKRDEYGDESSKGSDAPGNSDDDELDNEGKTDLYWIHLMQYEMTQLRQVYHARMRQLRVTWDDEVHDNALKEDFVGAVYRCSDGYNVKGILQWVEAVEKGEFPRLSDVLEPKPFVN